MGMVARAIDSTQNYSGEEKQQNNNNWIQITTDRILAAVMESLPLPVDVASKYETGKAGTIFIDVGGDNNEDKNKAELDFLASYQSDQGWNHFYFDYCNYLRSLYSLHNGVIQSGHEEYEDEFKRRLYGTTSGQESHGSQGGKQQEDSDESDNSEPSKVR